MSQNENNYTQKNAISPELIGIIHQLRSKTNWNIWAVVWERYVDTDGTTVDNTQEYYPQELLDLLIKDAISERQKAVIIRQLSNDTDDEKFSMDGIGRWIIHLLTYYCSWNKNNISIDLEYFLRDIIIRWYNSEFWVRFKNELGALLWNKKYEKYFLSIMMWIKYENILLKWK